jgi:hypothetical protein
MNRKLGTLLLGIALCGLLLAIPTAPVSANAAEPPSILIVVNNPPEDLSIALISGDGSKEAIAQQTGWEGYYTFYSWDLQNADNPNFRVTTGGESFEVTVNAPLEEYNNTFTLDLSNRTLSPGYAPFRSVLLVSLRVVLTLLLEGLVFFLFGFRQKKSWLIFLAVNLVTQGVLNIWLDLISTPSGYLIFALILGEVIVFVVEMIAFPLLVKEKKGGLTVLYAFAANLVSLIAGSLIITHLPV